MSSSSLKIVILMAGYGSRLRPHTWSRPKQLIRLADKMVLDYALDNFSSLPDPQNTEYIFVIGYLGEKIVDYMHRAHPDLNVRYVEQTEMRGQSHAISLAKDYLGGPAIVLYADTLIDTDFSFLASESADAVTWVKAVPDPRRFGVASHGSDGWVTHLVEKPKDVDNNLVLVGCYYFKDSRLLLQAIDEQMINNIALKNEFYLADAVNIMLDHGLKMRIERVETWLDAGTFEDVLKTNHYYLEHGHATAGDDYQQKNSVVIAPFYIHPSSMIENSIIGPHVTIGANCVIKNCILNDCIIDDGSQVTNMVLEHTLVGQYVQVYARPATLNLGDHTELSL